MDVDLVTRCTVLPQAFPAFVGATLVDPPVTPPFPDYNLDDLQRSDVAIRLTDTSFTSPPSESKLSHLFETLPFTEQRRAPLQLTSPPTHAIRGPLATSQTLPHISPSLRPDVLTEEPGEDVPAEAYLTHNEIKDKGKLKSGCTVPILTHLVIPSSITVSLLVQIQPFCQPWTR